MAFQAGKDNQQQHSLNQILTKPGKLPTINHTTTDVYPKKSQMPTPDVSGKEIAEQQVLDIPGQRSTTPNEHVHRSIFLSGYRHCALEVLHFMTKNMRLDPQNQVFKQLQTFLENTDILLSKDVMGTDNETLFHGLPGNLLLLFFTLKQ